MKLVEGLDLMPNDETAKMKKFSAETRDRTRDL